MDAGLVMVLYLKGEAYRGGGRGARSSGWRSCTSRSGICCPSFLSSSLPTPAPPCFSPLHPLLLHVPPCRLTQQQIRIWPSGQHACFSPSSLSTPAPPCLLPCTTPCLTLLHHRLMLQHIRIWPSGQHASFPSSSLPTPAPPCLFPLSTPPCFHPLLHHRRMQQLTRTWPSGLLAWPCFISLALTM